MTLKSIERQMESCIAIWLIGISLIRKERLYRDEYANFAHYAEQRWHVSRRHCDRWAAAGEILAELNPDLASAAYSGTPIGPMWSYANRPSIGAITVAEGHLRPLVALRRLNYTVEEIRQVWADAVAAAHDEPTAKNVRNEAKKYKRNSMGETPGKPGPARVRELLSEKIHDDVRKMTGNENLAVYVRVVTMEALLEWAENEGEIPWCAGTETEEGKE